MSRVNVPNTFTGFRVISVPILWTLALLGLQQPFGWLFALAALTDALDGYFARKLGLVSEFGAWFDSFADNLIYTSMPFWLWMLLPEFFSANRTIIICLAVLYGLDLSAGVYKYDLMVHYHLWSSKLAAIALFVFFATAFLWQPNQTAFFITASIVGISLLEEILVTLTSKKHDSDRKSLFS
ncbi:CDP-alcohol phosphatidyltransferase family protein [Candidatus Woesearchaeota archaeon]|nr:CDP-alcohol phosphatidyltransferase family protein [Candidatus Woesearchaeota archaeon]